MRLFILGWRSEISGWPLPLPRVFNVEPEDEGLRKKIEAVAAMFTVLNFSGYVVPIIFKNVRTLQPSRNTNN